MVQVEKSVSRLCRLDSVYLPHKLSLCSFMPARLAEGAEGYALLFCRPAGRAKLKQTEIIQGHDYQNGNLDQVT